MTLTSSLRRALLRATTELRGGWKAPLLAFAAAAAVAGSATANAYLTVGAFTPRDLSATHVQGKVDVRGDCRGYNSCRFHTSLERSSWRGYQTVSGSIISQRLGMQYPTAAKLTGWYDYKSHFHADITQTGICSSPRGNYACVKGGRITRDSSKIRLQRR